MICLKTHKVIKKNTFAGRDLKALDSSAPQKCKTSSASQQIGQI